MVDSGGSKLQKASRDPKSHNSDINSVYNKGNWVFFSPVHKQGNKDLQASMSDGQQMKGSTVVKTWTTHLCPSVQCLHGHILGLDIFFCILFPSDPLFSPLHIKVERCKSQRWSLCLREQNKQNSQCLCPCPFSPHAHFPSTLFLFLLLNKTTSQ